VLSPSGDVSLQRSARFSTELSSALILTEGLLFRSLSFKSRHSAYGPALQRIGVAFFFSAIAGQKGEKLWDIHNMIQTPRIGSPGMQVERLVPRRP
jgi:hypothetical protein